MVLPLVHLWWYCFCLFLRQWTAVMWSKTSVAAAAVVVAAVAVAVDDEEGIQWRRWGEGRSMVAAAFDSSGNGLCGQTISRRRWRLTPVVAGGNGGQQRLMAAMDEGVPWRLPVAMDGSCDNGGQ